jgi:REP-associated tyrosine transposase
MAQQEVITRRYLPHWFVPGAAHFITYRLYGTLPASALQELRSRKEALLQQKPKAGETPAQHRAGVHKRLFGIYDSHLDKGSGVRWLAEPTVAALVRSNLYHHHNGKYHLLAYCIMPNHVHALLTPMDRADQGAGGSPGAEIQQASRLHHEDELPVGEQADVRARFRASCTA